MCPPRPPSPPSGPPLGDALGAVEVLGTRSSAAGYQVDLYVINKVCSCHMGLPTAWAAGCVLLPDGGLNDGTNVLGHFRNGAGTIDPVGKPQVIVEVEDRRGIINKILVAGTDDVFLQVIGPAAGSPTAKDAVARRCRRLRPAE